MTKNTKAAKTEARNCECAKYFAVTAEILDNDGNLLDEATESTGCNATTRNDFAQGHDAKLKSHLIRWGSLGLEVVYVEGGLRVGTDAQNVANRYGFGHMVQAGIAKAVAKREAAKARADAKHAKAAEREALKAEVKAVLAEAPVEPVAVVEVVNTAREVVAKVGRWTYAGTEDTADGTFTYKNKVGQRKTTDKYEVVEVL